MLSGSLKGIGGVTPRKAVKSQIIAGNVDKLVILAILPGRSKP